MPQQPNDVYVGGFLDRQVHKVLVMVAAQFGAKATDLFIEYVRRGLNEDLAMIEGSAEHQEKMPAELRVAALYLKETSRELISQQMRKVIANMLERSAGTEEMDQVRSLADEVGLDFEELYGAIEDQIVAFGTAVESVEPNSKEAAAKWLRDFLSHYPENMALEADVIAAAEKDGRFSKFKLNRAKKLARVISRHIGMRWYWQLKVPNLGFSQPPDAQVGNEANDRSDELPGISRP